MARLALPLACALLLASVLPASAQQASAHEEQTPGLWGVTKQAIADPTTYAPAALLFGSMRLDWKSSQPLFQRGYVEDNPRYTVSGFERDKAVSYGEGNRRILRDALAELPISAAQNVVSHFIEQSLAERFPDHPRLMKTLGWIERLSFASYRSYMLSNAHFRQWQKNRQLLEHLEN